MHAQEAGAWSTGTGAAAEPSKHLVMAGPTAAHVGMCDGGLTGRKHSSSCSSPCCCHASAHLSTRQGGACPAAAPCAGSAPCAPAGLLAAPPLASWPCTRPSEGPGLQGQGRGAGVSHCQPLPASASLCQPLLVLAATASYCQPLPVVAATARCHGAHWCQLHHCACQAQLPTCARGPVRVLQHVCQLVTRQHWDAVVHCLYKGS